MTRRRGDREHMTLLREAETTSYGIEDSAAEPAWYGTAGLSPRLVGVCHTPGRRRHITHRLPCRVSHSACLRAALEAVSVRFEANNSFMRPCSGSEARYCSDLRHSPNDVFRL